MMRIILLGSLLCGLCAAQQIQLKTFCQGPIDQYGMSYNYMITSFTSQLTQLSPNCQAGNGPSNQLLLVIEGCGYRHCTQTMPLPYYGFVIDLPYTSQISIGLSLDTTTYYGNYTQPQNLYNCFTMNPDDHIYCLSTVQKESINCLMRNMAQPIDHQSCTPEWFYILIGLLAGLLLLFLVIWFLIWRFKIRPVCCCCRRWSEDFTHIEDLFADGVLSEGEGEDSEDNEDNGG